jgi:hypothetical protein
MTILGCADTFSTIGPVSEAMAHEKQRRQIRAGLRSALERLVCLQMRKTHLSGEPGLGCRQDRFTGIDSPNGSND